MRHPLNSALRSSVILRHVMRQGDGAVDIGLQEYRRCNPSTVEPLFFNNAASVTVNYRAEQECVFKYA
jgi:hypothetical protein